MTSTAMVQTTRLARSVAAVSSVRTAFVTMNNNHIVTAADVAEATGQDIESVARAWHEMANEDQNS